MESLEKERDGVKSVNLGVDEQSQNSDKTQKLKEEPFDFELQQAIADYPKKCKRLERKRARVDDFNVHSGIRSPSSMHRAAEVQANLDPKFPSFIKLMLRSHVTKGFWLGLPLMFCKLHLPKHDAKFILEGEIGEEYKTNYLANKVGMSGGWRRFSTAHKLLEGDALVFHLIEPFKFKLHIIRANLSEDEATKDPAFENNTRTLKKTRQINQNPAFFAKFENFNIVVKGKTVDDSDLSIPQKYKYFELCQSQNSYIHDRLLENTSFKLAIEIISQTIDIAFAIKTSKFSNSYNDFLIWDKNLEAFEIMGMNVGFLRDRLHQLAKFVLDSKRDDESKKYEEVQVKKEMAEEEIRKLESKISGLKERRDRIDHELEGLKSSAQRKELSFQEIANASW